MATITLCAVDTAHHELTKAALVRSSKLLEFDQVLFITDKELNVKNCNLKIIPTFNSGVDYNNFVLKELPKYVKTDYVLLIQYDGFIVEGKNWIPDFYNYDYIGAPWPFHNNYNVGNGGFSLRSKKLLNACLDNIITLQDDLEDRTICRYFKSYLEIKYGIKFAPIEIAKRFSYESGNIAADDAKNLFGFHGFHLLHNFYEGDNIYPLLNNIQPHVFKKDIVIVLAIQYYKRECYKETAEVLKRYNNTVEIAQQKYKDNFDTMEGFDKFWSLRNS